MASLARIRSVVGRSVSRVGCGLTQFGRREASTRATSSGKEFSHYEVRVRADKGGCETLSETMMCFGAQSVTLSDLHRGTEREEEIFSGNEKWNQGEKWKDTLVVGYFAEREACTTCIASCEEVLGEMLEYKVEEVFVETHDWENVVLESYQPIQISDALWIVPTTVEPPEKDAVSLMLSPGIAFGNGGHPTTKLCLRWLQSSIRGGEEVCDYGAGTGILAIGALKFGAKAAVATDIEETAVRITEVNARQNGIREGDLESLLVSSTITGRIPGGVESFDTIVANILMGPLLELKECFLESLKSGGKLGMSGILATQADEVARAYSDELEDVKIETLDEWAIVTGTKK
ncbi:ribosomal protein L11 methyltransferase [Chloropicon primus]|uniref:ETFB lysine methyltransferase n=1 Tax=Chloropicon primus TaxID=1764295 RepID=A0A5B8MSZ2_9CHLO|nr:ribosomal protein L11 methyltransferase [Chloropicon primus]UPR01969.1 ribosomal protein L11 methyltransferase [Chloropicon primus]|mmetsp:Transcript_3088/g.8425  ORF Transcript_3088/g.8425 Transcript_3088/m.8425 type:complete len:348 (-) Transcript_3088:707-1750(-)|eukprot:QDZ22745.1 ribosomal protein L11 methyltransferase [Chloropicon primus]